MPITTESIQRICMQHAELDRENERKRERDTHHNSKVVPNHLKAYHYAQNNLSAERTGKINKI